MSSVELWGRPGAPLGRRIAEELARRGIEAHHVDRPTGRLPCIDLALERSADGAAPPDPAGAENEVETPGSRLALSSTMAYHPSERHIGMAPESFGRGPKGTLAHRWRNYEERRLAAGWRVLRAAPCPVRNSDDRFSRWLDGRVVVSAFGLDPSIQILHPEDLTSALVWALGGGAPDGLTNIVPRRPVSLRRAARRAGWLRLPVPSSALRLHDRSTADYFRHPFTARGDRAREHGWEARYSSREAVALCRGASTPTDADTRAEDDLFGLDPRYTARLQASLFRFLHDLYWRVEYRGLEHLPRAGGAVLVGVHRGWMPWDGVMMLVANHRATGRYVRFLVHPGLLKPMVLAPYMNKIGGVVACRENADWMLRHDIAVGVFPEGINGAFREYKDWHRVDRFDRFGRSEFVRFALRHRVPIVPFATVGSAEIFPIVGKIRWPWLRRVAEWPFLPVTTPVPVPSKWHTDILEPIDLAADYPPEAADDPALVRKLAEDVRARLQESIDQMRHRRPSIFHGRVFRPGEAATGGERS